MLDDRTIKLLIAQRKMERDLNRHMAAFGMDGEITISDATRKLRQFPDLLKMIDGFIDSLDREEVAA